MSNGTNTAAVCLSNASKMGFFAMHPSSVVTFASGSDLVTPQHIREWLMSSQAVRPASPSVLPESEPEPTTRATCGPQCLSAYASYDPDSRLWKMYQGLLLPDILTESSATLPKAGMTLGGVCYRQPKWERRINEIGSGLLPTPAAQEPGWTIDGTVEVVGKNGAPPTHPNQRFYDKKTGRIVQKGLTQVTQMFPTPVVPNGGRQHNLENITLDGNTLYRKDGTKAQMDLQTYVRLWPTPKSRDYRVEYHTPGILKRDSPDLNKVIGGKLNPRWVEWLMDMPEGWTSLRPLEMHKWQVWLQQHGVYSQKD